MDGAFVKGVDGLLRGVSKILTVFEKSSILGVLLGFEFPSVYFSFLSRPHQLDQFANLAKINFFRSTIK